MRLKKAAMTGSAVGVGIAAVVILLNQWNRYHVDFQSPTSTLINEISFKLCPTYLLVGFMVRGGNDAVLFISTILSNALLYGGAFVLVAVVVSFFRNGAA